MYMTKRNCQVKPRGLLFLPNLYCFFYLVKTGRLRLLFLELLKPVRESERTFDKICFFLHPEVRKSKIVHMNVTKLKRKLLWVCVVHRYISMNE